VPFYLNTEAWLPLVRGLLDGEMSAGAALAFLITDAGPARTDRAVGAAGQWNLSRDQGSLSLSSTTTSTERAMSHDGRARRTRFTLPG
jgi:hypothetical protein